MGLHWLPTTALKTPMSVYLTLVLSHGLYHEVHKSLGPTETDESKPRTGLLGPQVYDGLVLSLTL